jgi:hypothetical protein
MVAQGVPLHVITIRSFRWDCQFFFEDLWKHGFEDGFEEHVITNILTSDVLFNRSISLYTRTM